MHVYSSLVVCAFYFIHANVSSDNHVITCARVAGQEYNGRQKERSVVRHFFLLPWDFFRWAQCRGHDDCVFRIITAVNTKMAAVIYHQSDTEGLE